jgi:hypothetical protein
MSNDKAILAAAILPSCGECRICRCHGDHCSLEAGEKCCWVDQFRTLCSNPRCVMAAAVKRKQYRRQAARAEARALKESSVPSWLRQRRNKLGSRRPKKAKGRAA